MSLRHAILGFLSMASMNGYDLKKAFDGSVQHFWPADQSQIYRTLSQLTETGLVQQEVIPREDRLDTKLYHITEAGRTELHRWLSTPILSMEDREPYLIQIFFGSHLTDAEMLHNMERDLASARQQLAEYEALYQMVVAGIAARGNQRQGFYSVLTLEYGIASVHAFIQWIERAIQRLKEGDYTPADFSELISR
jgi:PadR family transcriptional regulator AphA